VYLYKDAGGKVIYVGKAKSLRNRVRSYFLEDKLADVKTGTLIAEARDIDYILVDNEKEALALENNLIKQYKPRFNILLRDDKTYPYIKLTSEKYPRVYVTRRLRKDGATYFGPYFPANLAHRLVHFIHRHFWCRPARSISPASIPSRACNITFTAAWDRASKASPPTMRTPPRSATCACFWKAATPTWRAICARAWQRRPTTCASRKPPPCAIC
jgi:excinuclease UvrABC nuclease subunit